MASEYYKWKYKDVTPDAPPPPLGRKEKALNWLYYHKLWLIAGAAVLLVVGTMLWNILGIGQVKPDYVFAYVGKNELPEETAQALTEGLASLGQDVNGDGRVKVQLNQYATARSGEPETALYYNYAADSRLLADITARDSYFFLMEDPKAVQQSYQILARWDGAPPEEKDYEAGDKAVRWADCPALAGLDIPEAEDLFLGRRCFYEEKTAADQGRNEDLWTILVKGAKR